MVLVLLAGLALAACDDSGPDGAQPFLGYWRLPETEVGGDVLLRISAHDGALEVTAPGYYFGDSAGEGPLTHDAQLEGDRLIALGNGTAPDAVSVQFTSGDGGTLSMLLPWGDSEGHNPMDLQRARGSDQELAAEMDRQIGLETGIRTLSAGVLAWTQAHGGTLPWAREVRPDSTFARATVVRSAMGEWPVNPFTGRALQPGDGPGDYQYETDHHKRYRIQANATDTGYGSVYLINYP